MLVATGSSSSARLVRGPSLRARMHGLGLGLGEAQLGRAQQVAQAGQPRGPGGGLAHSARMVAPLATVTSTNTASPDGAIRHR